MGTVQDLIEDGIDDKMLEKFVTAKNENKRLRYKFVIDRNTKKCRCFLDAVDEKDALYRLKQTENLIQFETNRYDTSPLIVKGAAAGPELNAAGIFSDLLRLTRAYSIDRF